MCDFSGKLIAWLDQELTATEAVEVERHVGHCAECRLAVRSYREISEAFLHCYVETMTAQPGRKPWGWIAAAGGIAAAILLGIVLDQRPAETLAIQPPPPPPAPISAYETPVYEKPVRRAAASMPIVKPQWTPVEPTVEVALPADALFPPGAVPAGFSFIADIRPQP